MTKEEAAKIIDTIRESVENQPNQFHLTVHAPTSVTGAVGIGGPGLTTIQLGSVIKNRQNPATTMPLRRK